MSVNNSFPWRSACTGGIDWNRTTEKCFQRLWFLLGLCLGRHYIIIRYCSSYDYVLIKQRYFPAMTLSEANLKSCVHEGLKVKENNQIHSAALWCWLERKVRLITHLKSENILTHLLPQPWMDDFDRDWHSWRVLVRKISWSG